MPSTPKEMDDMCNLDRYIRQHAEQHPSKTAITCGAQTLTYAQLRERYLSVARALSQHGVQPGDIVAVACERNADLIVLLLAILGLDCTYLPVDKLNPAQRVEYTLSNSGAGLVVVDEPLPIDGTWTQVLLRALQDEAGDTESFLLPEPSHDGFCIMYTSGTTGKPKGTLLRKDGVFNHFDAKIACLQMDRDSVVAQNAGYYFVNSIWQLFSPFVVGAELVVYDRHVMHDMDSLVQRMQHDRVSVLQAVPTFWTRFFEHVEQNKLRFEHLRCLVSTSEKLTHSLAAVCFRCFNDVALVNAYGMTECSDDVLHHQMRSVPAGQDIPIGTPAPNTRIYILDDEDRPCAPGEKGEICVAGVGVSGSYLNAPEQTARAFVDGAALGLPETLLYRTGDIGFQQDDGSYVYLGRKDYQVKISGYRVELFEIESVLLACPGITQAAAIFPQVGGSGRLIAYYTATREIDTGSLRAFLRERLPGYMIPLEFIEVDAFPLTAMEKIDRKKLYAVAAVQAMGQAASSPTIPAVHNNGRQETT